MARKRSGSWRSLGASALTELVIYGATGSTGHRVAGLAVAMGARPTLAGRRAAALERMAEEHGGLEVRVAELERSQLDRAFEGAKLVVSCAGPYSLIGRPVADAAVRAGAHYVDFSGEPRWVQELIDEVDGPARAAGTAIVPAVGGGVAAELAAHLAARPLEVVERLTIGLRIIGMRPSSASVRSSLELAAGGAPVVSAGATTFEKTGSRSREFPGDLPGALFSSPDAQLLGRIWPRAHCETYMQFPAFVITGRLFAAAGSGLRRPGLLGMARTGLAAASGTLARLQGSGGRVVATAMAEDRGQESAARAFSDGIYDLTGRAGWAVIDRLLSGGHPPSGVRSWCEIAGSGEDAAAAAGVRTEQIG